MLLAPPMAQVVALGGGDVVRDFRTLHGAWRAFSRPETIEFGGIVSGFGGTLNLTLFRGGAIFPFGFLFHWRYIGRLGEPELSRGSWCNLFAFRPGLLESLMQNFSEDDDEAVILPLLFMAIRDGVRSLSGGFIW
jgi:hypothetical protein